MRWEHLRVSIYHKGDDKIDFVAKREKEFPSIATHDSMEGHFNVACDKWDAYLQKLKESGWELVSIDERIKGREETYHFKRSKSTG